ncbi:MAG: signal recognition particle-docking protein FtsY [Actinobacteria bacterium]|nr:signal recognition particle-docking protein FtsY [Actinomycetota bacterium]
MIPALIAAGVVLAALAGWWLWARSRRRSTPAAAITRDTPTVAPDALTGGLAGTRAALGGRLAGLFGGGPSEADWEAVEEALLAADAGVAATAAIVARLRERRPGSAAELREALHSEILAVFEGADRGLRLTGDPVAVVVVVGVNGSGKTTTIAKLGALLEREGRSVLLGAGDTFRAAAAEQLAAWAGRLGLDVVRGQAGGDPAAVAFDAYAAARARGKDVVIVDTAGRLHSKHNLMEELGKVVRVLEREAGPVGEVLLVLDGTSGQNAIAQARAFTAAVGVTGVIVTKLDGTARGGIALAVEHDLGIPVKYLGVGEGAGDLLPFDAPAFADALVGG